MKKLTIYLLLLIIVAVAFYARLYKIDNPIADWHAWRQADTAAVSRSFLKEGFNPFIPKYDDMSGVAQDPVPNPGRYRFVEFPIYNSIVYFVYLITGDTHERIPRLVSVFFSIGSLIFIYLIGKKYWGEVAGILSAALFATLPYAVFYSRVVLPEPSLVFYCLGMFYAVGLWIENNTKNRLLTAVIFTALAFLTKPFAIFYLMPHIYSFRIKEGRWWPIPKCYLYYILLSFTPFILWRLWILQHPEGIPASNWLLNGNGIRFRPAFFKWIVGERFGREILGVGGVILLALGGLLKPKQGEGWTLHLLLLSSLLYLVVFATGNVQHDYYQYLIAPVLILFTVRGFMLLFTTIPQFIPRYITIPVALFLLVLTIYLPWNEVKGLYQINNGIIVEAGHRADDILPKNAKVVAPYNGDTSFLYYVNRPGWAFLAYPIEDLVKNYGITHYVSVNFDDQTNKIIKKYKVVEKTEKYVIIDVTKLSL
ncbi:hypothetical protein A3H85_00840 [Candidatus Daviesbacteria bacterium RIFCSPLOWO2_02_FULL_40_8]|uniref:Glycosyltransferase RgtA/B/C/D-like domain-containing protein n=1 Tax=Candidatus Daviesbacteria bacterium RIFCSPLOWO2_01_FULL_40_24 TaxID=1797787 RepID=A0A1F5MJ59_9BACT|nr:MAG: hypothetical protein A3C32_04135 [Candidatus Daviesbacteria bacterium RIFCSPHIGHO2_02_FULL_41_14]OGE65416.1 MAG: hypothetical protein A3B49_00830 [Candidatus Daviesbacteria bacterium RIFCSPLOWO2_01_FULL_40_24]OGE66978.1 MAG: hypothetical protein A3H85_00840 [Candidatus Daviesbacteria bacterium RIFCSPLOWO2_02_FULL_40_8]